MSITEEIGRVILTRCTRSEAENLSEYLTFSGIEPMICLDEEGELFLVAVNSEDEEKARQVFERFNKETVREGSGSKRRSSPTMQNVLKRMKRISNSSFFFIICGGFIFLMSAVRLFKISEMSVPLRIFNITELVFGFGFTIFGIVILVQSILARQHLKKENSFMLSVLRDFLNTYSYEDIDKIIEAEDTDTEGANASPAEARKNFIRKYLSREYDIIDPEYLEYLTQEIYISLYQKRKLN